MNGAQRPKGHQAPGRHITAAPPQNKRDKRVKTVEKIMVKKLSKFQGKNPTDTRSSMITN